MPQYIRKIKGIRNTGAFLATGGKTGKKHNLVAGPAIGDGVFKDKNGNTYQIQGNLIRYFDSATGRWGEWMLNPKFNPDDALNYTGKKRALTAMEFTGGFPDFYAPKPVWNATGKGHKKFTGIDSFFNEKQPSGWPFTGDTGGTLNWQIGFEDPPYYGLFGSKRKKEESAVADAMGEARRDHPPANSCAEAEAGIRSVRAHIESTQRSIDDGSTSSRVGPRYLAAYNTILQEYTNFYNNNCLVVNDPGPLDTGMLVDPILHTALPSVPATPSQVAAAQQQNTATTQQQAASVAPGNIAAPASSKSLAVPKWALYAGVGLAAVSIIALLLKKKAAS